MTPREIATKIVEQVAAALVFKEVMGPVTDQAEQMIREAIENAEQEARFWRDDR